MGGVKIVSPIISGKYIDTPKKCVSLTFPLNKLITSGLCDWWQRWSGGDVGPIL